MSVVRAREWHLGSYQAAFVAVLAGAAMLAVPAVLVFVSPLPAWAHFAGYVIAFAENATAGVLLVRSAQRRARLLLEESRDWQDPRVRRPLVVIQEGLQPWFVAFFLVVTSTFIWPLGLFLIGGLALVTGERLYLVLTGDPQRILEQDRTMGARFADGWAREQATADIRRAQARSQTFGGPAAGSATVRPRFDEAMAELDALVGLGRVKDEVHDLVALMRVEEARAKARRRGRGATGGRVRYAPTLHAVFVGPPGTGKTTVARLYGRLLAAMGYLADGHLVEVDRAGLVGEYIGQTAPKVHAAVQRALGGVLFVDEAYSLVAGGVPNDFGHEALAALIADAENYRGRVAIVLAGYEPEMRRLLTQNPGMESRFPRVLHFEPYDAGALAEITTRLADGAGLRMAPEAASYLRAWYGANAAAAGGNGRLARNVLERCRQTQARRLVREGLRRGADLGLVTAEDVATACAEMAP